MVSMKIICGVLLWHGRLVEDQASAAYERMVWVLTKCEGYQRRQETDEGKGDQRRQRQTYIVTSAYEM
jgi:hypothetical protein